MPLKIIIDHIGNKELERIAEKVLSGQRITTGEALMLYMEADLPLLAFMAGSVRRRINGNMAFFNRNIHIEPTNICIHNCLFCSYRRPANDPESWDYSHEEILEKIRQFNSSKITEVHITGGVHPARDIHYYGELVRKIKETRPDLHVKAFSAIELDNMIRRAGLSIEDGLRMIRGYGVDSIPGGGAEIFDEELRKKICPGKTLPALWLEIHETAHRLGLMSNATMLYGHIETYSHRVDHMERLRSLQDKTRGFNAFIPLKFRKANNSMEELDEVSLVEDMRNYAVARIFLDNIAHIKAYWPMIGREAAQISLLFGTDDLDGTIEDTTKIYSMAGAGDKNPVMTVDNIKKLIVDAGFQPVERDSLYNAL